MSNEETNYMSILRSVSLPFSQSPQTFSQISLEDRAQQNTFTVFVGKNGTRKSFLLRSLLDSALVAVTQKEVHDLGILDMPQDGTTFYRLPSKVIAISAAPTDRFPSKPAASDRIRVSKYDVAHYSYVGPRTASNILSRNQSVDELVRAILGRPDVLANRKRFLCDITGQLRVLPKFQIGFDFSVLAKNGDIIEYIENRIRDVESKKRKLSNDVLFLEALNFSKSTSGHKYIDEINRRLSSYSDSKRAVFNPRSALDISNYACVAYVDCKLGKVGATDGISVDALEWATRIGFLRPRRFTFFMASGAPLDQDDLSAGQWSLFSTMVTLSLAVTDETLVLVDEPETGLHPAWQRTFLDTVKRAIEHVNGCHVVLATHSPLLLSSLDPDVSNLILLTYDEARDEVTAKMEIIPFGWDASVILQDTFDLDDARAPELTTLVDEALSLIARGKKGNLVKLKRLAKRMVPYYESLPDEDMGKSVIGSIIKVVSAETKTK